MSEQKGKIKIADLLSNFEQFSFEVHGVEVHVSEKGISLNSKKDKVSLSIYKYAYRQEEGPDTLKVTQHRRNIQILLGGGFNLSKETHDTDGVSAWLKLLKNEDDKFVPDSK